jgi:hypothetical protein
MQGRGMDASPEIPAPEQRDDVDTSDVVVVAVPVDPPVITASVARVLLRILLRARDNQC